MSMLIEVWGDYACFTRPEMKTERVSYDMITPSLRGALWRPSTGTPGCVIRLTASICSSPSASTPRMKRPPRNTPSAHPIHQHPAQRGQVHPAVLRRPQCGQGRHAAGALHLGGHPAAGRDGPAGRPLRHRVPLRFDGQGRPQRQSRQVPGHPAPTPAQGPVLSPAVSGAGSSRPTSGSGRAAAFRR